jgi:hypothetical protein
MVAFIVTACESVSFEKWSPHPDSNRRPLPYQGSALPPELCGHNFLLERETGLEPATLSLEG